MYRRLCGPRSPTRAMGVPAGCCLRATSRSASAHLVSADQRLELRLAQPALEALGEVCLVRNRELDAVRGAALGMRAGPESAPEVVAAAKRPPASEGTHLGVVARPPRGTAAPGGGAGISTETWVGMEPGLPGGSLATGAIPGATPGATHQEHSVAVQGCGDTGQQQAPTKSGKKLPGTKCALVIPSGTCSAPPKGTSNLEAGGSIPSGRANLPCGSKKQERDPVPLCGTRSPSRDRSRPWALSGPADTGSLGSVSRPALCQMIPSAGQWLSAIGANVTTQIAASAS
jgi:hypothetical protein